MSNKGNTSFKDLSLSSHEISIHLLMRFWIILPFYIPSVICSLFVLYHFITNHTLRQALHNHVITILLLVNFIVQLTDIPFTLSYYYLGYVWPQSPVFCTIWIVIHEGLFITITALFAWATIERHILIFHDRLVLTHRRIIIFHYTPTITVSLYCFCYIMIVIILPPCANTYNYEELTCGEPLCFYEEELLAMWDVIVNHLIPVIIIVLCSFTLLLRILYQKCQMRQPTHWRKYRKMTVQLLAISLLYLIIYIPHMFMEFLQLCCISEEIGADFMVYSEFFAYYGTLLLPFVCAGSMPELKIKLKNMFCLCWKRQERLIHPHTLPLSRRAIDRQ